MGVFGEHVTSVLYKAPLRMLQQTTSTCYIDYTTNKLASAKVETTIFITMISLLLLTGL